MNEPQEPLTKDLGFGLSARLDPDGTLTLAESRTGYNALEQKVMAFTEIPLPAQTVRALLNFLVRDESRARIGHRRWQGSKPTRNQ